MTSASGTSALRSALTRFSSSSGSRSSAASGSATSAVPADDSVFSGGGGAADFNLVLDFLAPAGAHVKKGDRVAEFDRLNMLNRLDDFRVSVQDQENGLKTLKANIDIQKKAHRESIASAKGQLDKAELDLKTIPVQSDIQAQQLKLAAEEARARYQQLLKEVKDQEASWDAEYRVSELDYKETMVEFQRAEANVDKMVFRAPIDGLVVMGTTFRGSEFDQIKVGDEVHPGMSFMQVVDTSSMIINATVNQVDVDSLRIGMKANVKFDAYPDLVLPAHVYSIAAMPQSGGSRLEYVKQIPVVLKLDRVDERVIPDLSVAVDVTLESAAATTVAPLESVFHDARSGEDFVFVRRGSAWERRPVETGVVNNVFAAIRSGVRPGDVLAAEWPIENKGK